MKTIIGLCIIFLIMMISGCTSQEKEIDFTQIASGSEMQSGSELKKEEPIEVIEEDIVEILDSNSGVNLMTGEVIDSLSSLENQ